MLILFAFSTILFFAFVTFNYVISNILWFFIKYIFAVNCRAKEQIFRLSYNFRHFKFLVFIKAICFNNRLNILLSWFTITTILRTFNIINSIFILYHCLIILLHADWAESMTALLKHLHTNFFFIVAQIVFIKADSAFKYVCIFFFWIYIWKFYLFWWIICVI